MKIIGILLITVLSVTSDMLLYASDGRFFTNLSTGQGLSHSTVLDICQDRDGYMWFATINGLNKYDSHQIRRYFEDTTPGLISNQIRSLCPYGENLLIGTDKGVCLYDRKTDQFREIICEKGIKPYVQDMEMGFDGVIYIAARQGIWSFDGGSYARNVCDEPGVIKISIDKSGGIWVVTEKEILFLSERGDIIERYGISDFSDILDSGSIFSEIYVDAHGIIWVGTVADGLFRMDEKNKKLLPYHIECSDKNIQYVRCIYYGHDGNLWIGGENGLFEYDIVTQKCSHYTKDYDNSRMGISGNATYCIFKSSDDVIWAGTYFGGIDYTDISNRRLSFVTPDGGKRHLGGSATRVMMEDKTGRIWYGSEDNGITIMDPSGKITYLNTGTTPALHGDNIHSITEDSRGNIWVGYYLKGISRISSDLKKIDHICPNLPNIHRIICIKNDTLLISTGRGVYIYPSEDNEVHEFRTDVFGGKSTFIHMDKNGKIWISTSEGSVYTYLQGSRQPVVKTGINENLLTGTNSSDGSIWFCNDRQELIKIDTKRNTVIRREEIKDANIYPASIQEDTHRRLWISTNNGIILYSPRDQKTHKYFIANEIISNQFVEEASLFSKNGKLYLGSINGVCILSPNTISDSNDQSHEITLDITCVSSDGRMISHRNIREKLNENESTPKAISLKHNQNSLIFNIIPISFRIDMQERMSIWYKMSGTDDDYTQVRAEPIELKYEHIHPGTHTLEIYLADSSGHIISGDKFEIHISPDPLYSWWMICIYFLMAISIIVFTSSKILKFSKRHKLLIESSRKAEYLDKLTTELRSPVSIISAALDNDTFSIKDSPISGQELETVSRNIKKIRSIFEKMIRDTPVVCAADDTTEAPENYEDIPTKEEETILENHKYTILLAEGDDDFCQFLSRRLNGRYHVISVKDGEQATQLISPKVDIAIISNELPHTGGAELCRYIKGTDYLRHIPVVIMGNQQNETEKITSLEQGAYTFIHKPFSFHELNVVLKNIIIEKNSLRRYYQDKVNLTDIEHLTNKDGEFIDGITGYIRKNIQNNELDVSMLADYAHISKSLMYSKLKNVINMSASNLIMKVRMEEAAVRLTNTEKSISEISWELGFSSPSYFVKAFKKYYDKTPKEYRLDRQ